MNDTLETIAKLQEDVATKKRKFVDEVAQILKDDEKIANTSLQEIEDSWKTFANEQHNQLDEEYHQVVRNFKKQKERVDIHTEGKRVKEELIKELEEVKESDNFKEVSRIAYQIKQDFDDAPYAGKLHDGELNRKFHDLFNEVIEAKDAYFGSLETNRKDAKAKKEELIEKAKKAATSTHWKDTAKEMRELMSEWKEVGHAGREYNDALWEEFNAARQEFFTKQDEFFKKQHEKFEQAKIEKDKLIEEAKSINLDEDIKATSEKMKDLMNRWKQAGSSGREHDDPQWNAFQEARKVFYDRQSEYYDAKKGKFIDNLYDGIKRRNKQLSDLEKIVSDLQERIKEIKNLDPVMGNNEDRWEITNERNQEMKKYQDAIDEYTIKITKLQEELKEMDDKYKNLTE